jgi:lysozyme
MKAKPRMPAYAGVQTQVSLSTARLAACALAIPLLQRTMPARYRTNMLRNRKRLMPGTQDLLDTQDAASALAMGAAICKRFEGCVLTAYHGSADRAGLYTIGWGTTSIDGQPVQPGTTISQAQADQYLNDTLGRIQTQIESALQIAIEDYRKAALISFAYNLGFAALSTSTLLHLVNAGDFAGACGQFGLWIHANGVVVPGLVARRAYEAQVFDGTATPT